MSSFPAGFVAELPAETFAGFTADQISNLEPLYFVENNFGPGINISPEQISHITLDAMAGLTAGQIGSAGAVSGNLIGAFSPEQISHLNAPILNDGSADYSLMQHAMVVLSQHPETVEDFTDADMSFSAGGCELVSCRLCCGIASRDFCWFYSRPDIQFGTFIFCRK